MKRLKTWMFYSIIGFTVLTVGTLRINAQAVNPDVLAITNGMVIDGTGAPPSRMALLLFRAIRSSQ